VIYVLVKTTLTDQWVSRKVKSLCTVSSYRGH